MFMVILYVDDDDEDWDFFNDAIKQIDPTIECTMASNGMAALDLLNSHSTLPDFIFLDINMPLMDGKTCLIELKKSDKFRHIPVVMYSTTSDTREINECYKLGAFDFLIKPNVFQKLCEDLDSILIQLKREGGNRIR
jgi:CheY-like chemotaxis protein